MKEKFYDVEKIKKLANSNYTILISQRNLCPSSIRGKKFELKTQTINAIVIPEKVLYIGDEIMVEGILCNMNMQKAICWEMPYKEFIEKFKKGEIKLWKKEKQILKK